MLRVKLVPLGCAEQTDLKKQIKKTKTYEFMVWTQQFIVLPWLTGWSLMCETVPFLLLLTQEILA